MLQFVKKYWVPFLIILAVLASYQTSQSREDNQHDASVVACIAGSQKTAVLAAGWHELSQRVAGRGNAGDARSAQLYQATSNSLIELIPAPTGSWGPTTHIADANVVPNGVKGLKFVLTPEARGLEVQGCEDRFK